MSATPPPHAVVFIRRAVPADTATLRAVILPSWRSIYLDRVGAENLARMAAARLSAQALLNVIGDPGLCAALAFAGPAAAGAVFARPRAGQVHIDSLHVRAGFKRRGVGRALLDFAAGAFSSCAGMTLNVEAANAEALAFYLRLGFRVVGEGAEDVAGVSLAVRMLAR